MEIQEILNALEFNKDRRFPREALEAATEQREAIVPHLMQFIERAYECAQHPEDMAEDGHAFIGHIYAMFLLAQFRERAAYPLIVKFFSLPGRAAHDITGDLVTEDLPNILASVCCGDTSLIKGLVENQGLDDEYVRSAAVRSFPSLVVSGQMSREEAIAYYAELFRGKLEREPSAASNSLVICAAELGAEELRADIDRAYAEGFASPFWATREELEYDLTRDKEEVPEYLRGQRYGLVESVFDEMEWWACFRQERRYRPKPKRPAPLPRPLRGLDLAGPSSGPEPAPAARVDPKPGRNDPCPCGSGRKFKHCCAGKPQ